MFPFLLGEPAHLRKKGSLGISGNAPSKVKRSGLKCFDSFLVTLDNWLDEITNYFLDRQTSGLQEGFNNKIKVLKRRCYGITNISHLFQRIWLDLEGFKFYGI